MMDRKKGTVKKWLGDKGFGFISMDDGQDVFVHRSAVSDGRPLAEGERVTFELTKGAKGLRAEDVLRA